MLGKNKEANESGIKQLNAQSSNDEVRGSIGHRSHRALEAMAEFGFYSKSKEQ